MKLVSYYTENTLRPGVLVDDDVVDIRGLTAGTEQPYHSVKDLLSAGPDALLTVSDLVASDDGAHLAGTRSRLRLGPCVPDPGKIICIGLNYRAHAAESGRELPETPTFFAKYSNSLIGPDDDIQVPPIEDPRVDFEGELAVVIGRTASRVTEADALDFVAGVSVFNDVTSRRLQYATTQWTNGKAIDDFGPLGPAVVTLDEIADVQNLELRTRVNGTEVQEANTKSMIWTVAELVSIISATIRLEPGDIIATGTPEGIGAKRNPPMYLKDGDVVEVEIDQVGLIENRIVAP